MVRAVAGARGQAAELPGPRKCEPVGAGQHGHGGRVVERRPEHGAAGRAVPERHGVLGAAGLPHGRADQVLGI